MVWFEVFQFLDKEVTEEVVEEIGYENSKPRSGRPMVSAELDARSDLYWIAVLTVEDRKGHPLRLDASLFLYPDLDSK